MLVAANPEESQQGGRYVTRCDQVPPIEHILSRCSSGHHPGFERDGH